MRKSSHPLLAAMTLLMSHPLKRLCQWLLGLLIGLPVAWAAGISINSLVITTVKQLAFGQTQVEMTVGAQYTQAATVRLSPGAVSYRSSDAKVATVNVTTGQITGVLAGEATITADQAAAPPYPAASASYRLKVTGQGVKFNSWALAPVTIGTAPYQIALATSNSAGAITYSVEASDAAIAGITPAGQVTVKGVVGSATIVATQAANGIFGASTTTTELEVKAAPSAPFTWPAQTATVGTPLTLQAPTNSPNTQGAYGYTVANQTIATIQGNVLTPIAEGTTTITVTQAASGIYPAASLTVQLTVLPVPPVLAFNPVDLASNKFGATLKANSSIAGATFTYAFVSPAAAANVAELSASGELLVKGPGTLQVEATQQPIGKYGEMRIRTTVTIQDGVPGVMVTSAPKQELKPGDIFSITYKLNFPLSSLNNIETVILYGGTFPETNFLLRSHTLPPRVGENGVITFQVVAQANAATRQSTFYLQSIYPDGNSFSGSIDGLQVATPLLVVINPVPPTLNLGAPLQLVYDPSKPVSSMPKTYDSQGVEITTSSACKYFRSSNENVLRGTGLGPWDKDHWIIVGVGDTTITCDAYSSYYQGVTMTVTGIDPKLQNFPDIVIGMDSLPYPLSSPYSLNTSAQWSYVIQPNPGQPAVVATIEGGRIVPKQVGTATITATQAAGNNYLQASISAQLKINEPPVRQFGNISATYGDLPFYVPRPNNIDSSVNLTYVLGPPGQDVATIDPTTGKLVILNADMLSGVKVSITAMEGATVRATGQLTVKRAIPKLLFNVPPRAYGISACGVNWTWPKNNEGTNNSMGGALITNSDAVPYYPMGSVTGSGGSTGLNPGGDYWYRRMAAPAAYTEADAVWKDAVVVLAQTRNFEAATSSPQPYALWASENVFFSQVNQQWYTSCSQ